jgi:hypothetical protein
MRGSVVPALIVAIALMVTGCSGGSGGGGGNSNPLPTVSLSASPSTITLGQSTTLTVSTMNATSCSGATGLSGSVTTNGTLTETPTAAGTITYGITCTGAGGSASASTTVTVNPQPNAVTSVTLKPATASTTDYQPLTLTPTVVATGSDATTVNLSVSPASAGTLSATSNVASGTAVTFTPAGTGAGSATITATATADTTKSATATVTITLRTITISIPQQIAWLPNCLANPVLVVPVTQTGIEAGDTMNTYPYPTDTFTQAPGNTFNVTLGIYNDYKAPNADGTTATCSPGAYDFYVTGKDGATSNHQYLPVVPAWNQWAGYNSTDEFVEDYAGNQTCKFKLSDGTSDGCIPVSGEIELVDETTLFTAGVGGNGVSWFNTATGAKINSMGRSTDVLAGMSEANGIMCYTGHNSQSGEQEASCGATTTSSITDYPTPNDQLGAIVMSNACGAASNEAHAYVIDEDAPQLLELDATAPSGSGGSVSVSLLGSVALSKFIPVSSLPANAYYPYDIVAIPNSCYAVVLAPVLNSSASGGITMQLALVDMTNGTPTVVGYDNDPAIPTGAIEMTADPSGNAVVIAGVNESTGTSPLLRVSWTLTGNTPAFTSAALPATGPAGTYCVGLGILPNEQASCAQRGKVTHVAAVPPSN